MQICLMIEGQESVSWDEWLALARACEDAGIETLFRSDHYASVFGVPGRGSLDAWAVLAGLAAATDRLRLGTLVSPATFRHPSVFAKMATTVDHISGGRVEVGLGAGWHEREHSAFGFPFFDMSTRVEIFAEQLEIVHRQWNEDVVDFAGRHYTLDACEALPRPVQDPHPPLIVGGMAGRGTVEPAVRFADEYNTAYASPDTIRARRRRIDEACERAGRDPASLRYSLMTSCIVGEDRSSIAARTRRVAEQMGESGDPEAFLREQGESWLVGTPDEIVERLGLFEEAGIERVMLQQLDHADVDMVALIGREVRPRVVA